MAKRLILLAALLLLSACTLGPDYERPELDLPSSELDATLLSEAQREAMAYWWTRFRDPALNRLIDSALDDNLDIALQAARLREGRAQLGLANAQLYPTLQGQVEATHQKTGGASSPRSGAGASGAGAGAGGGASPLQGSGQGFDYFSVAAVLSYELDIFGALRRGRESAAAQLLSSAYTRDSIRLSVISDVVATYMSLRASQRQIRVTQQTIETREQALTLDEKRYELGAIGQLELLQTRSLLASARAQLPQLRQQASELESALAILTGKTPREIMVEADVEPGDFDDIHLPGGLPVVLPSALVNRRPDIRAAEATLIATNANIGVVKAQFFPSFNLSAMIGTAALDIDNLFEPYSETRSLAGAITAPILTFGRLEARYDTAVARREQAEIMYRSTVRTAFGEVRDALVAVQLTQERVQAVRLQAEAFADTLELARIRYEVGRVAFFAVLDAQRQLFQAQLTLAEAIRDRFVATANLFKALGGGWTANSDSISRNLKFVPEDLAPQAAADDT